VSNIISYLRTLSLITIISPESFVDCTTRSRDIRHLSAWVAGLREIVAASPRKQRDPHRNRPNYVYPRLAARPHPPRLERTRLDDLSYTTGKGDTDSTLRKTAYAMFFCATNPDPNANGGVWALLQNGAIQRMEEAQERGSLGEPPAYADL
jgi:hypothetical protein